MPYAFLHGFFSDFISRYTDGGNAVVYQRGWKYIVEPTDHNIFGNLNVVLLQSLRGPDRCLIV